MERELWTILSRAVAQVDRTFADNARYGHRTSAIVRVYLWAALHDRPIDWATKPGNWPVGMRERRKGQLPGQSTVSRRTRGKPGQIFQRFLDALATTLSGRPEARRLDLKCLDGKPLVVARHSKDPDAKFGRGAGGLDRGYKLHALWGTSILPEAFRVAPLDVDERAMARRLLDTLEGHGYILADGNYDANYLFALGTARNYQLLAPRDTPGAGLSHRRHRPGRLRSIQLLEPPMVGSTGFGLDLFDKRKTIEQRLGNLTTGVGALSTGLPPFVRRIWRVRTWVTLKLLIYAARVIQRTQQKPDGA
jgi:hypothetical protein